MEEVVLATEKLTKRFGGKTVVDGVSLKVRRGEAYGFLGPNGAGKTTVMRMILGLVAPSSGTVTLFGRPAGSGGAEARSRIGAVSEKPYLYADMTAAEYLKFFADLYRVPDPYGRIRRLLERFDLMEHAGKKLKAFSQGMQQRINIARALLHDPDLLLLDEPVSGLDPHGIRIVRDLIVEGKSAGRSILISSHLISIVETVCDRVGIMSAGRLLVEETVQAIREKIDGETAVQVEVAEVNEGILQAVSSLTFVQSVEARSNRLLLKVLPEPDARQKISRRIAEAGGTVLMVALRESSLEDAFLELTEKNVALLARRSDG